MSEFKSYFGIIAGTCTTISFLPQLLKVWKSKSAQDISLLTFLVFTTGVALWLVYGFLLNDTPIIISNTITLILAGSILVLKIRFSK